MGMAFHVNGEARARVALGTGGAGGLVDLGISIDGADIDITDHTEQIFTDSYGPLVPFEEQQFLSDATIRYQLIFYDESVFMQVRGRPNVEGAMGLAGALWGQQGGYFRLCITSPYEEFAWNFWHVRLRDAASVKLSTRRAVWNCTFYAVPWSGTPGSTLGKVLYDHNPN